MIKRLFVDNYKCLVNFELPLEELSLLLGPSGVGKTSVLEIIFALRRLLSGDARVTDADVFPPRTLTRWQSRNLQVFEIQVVLGSETFAYRLELEHDTDRRLARIQLEQLEVNGGPLFECIRSEVQLYRDDHSKGPAYTADWRESALARVAERHDNTRLTKFMTFIRNVLVCSFHPPRFQTVSSDENPLLSRDGSNFADWFRHALQERPDLNHEYIKALRNVIGAGFAGVRLEKVSREARTLLATFDRPVVPELQNKKDYELQFDEISDGQRALIVLYGLIHLARDQGYSLFLDEPENYVALREIQPWLTSLQDACGEGISQSVISSHHPELIDYLGTDYGILLRRETSGVIAARSLERGSNDGGIGVELSELFARGWES